MQRTAIREVKSAAHRNRQANSHPQFAASRNIQNLFWQLPLPVALVRLKLFFVLAEGFVLPGCEKLCQHYSDWVTCPKQRLLSFLPEIFLLPASPNLFVILLYLLACLEVETPTTVGRGRFEVSKVTRNFLWKCFLDSQQCVDYYCLPAVQKNEYFNF